MSSPAPKTKTKANETKEPDNKHNETTEELITAKKEAGMSLDKGS